MEKTQVRQESQCELPCPAHKSSRTEEVLGDVNVPHLKMQKVSSRFKKMFKDSPQTGTQMVQQLWSSKRRNAALFIRNPSSKTYQFQGRGAIASKGDICPWLYGEWLPCPQSVQLHKVVQGVGQGELWEDVHSLLMVHPRLGWKKLQAGCKR